MSADNTIVILKNKCRSGGHEYRVALVTAAENVYPMEKETEADFMARKWFNLYWFGRSKVYFNSRKARANARRRLLRMTKQRRVLEFGIARLDRGDELFPEEDQKSIEAWLRQHDSFPFQKTSYLGVLRLKAMPAIG